VERPDSIVVIPLTPTNKTVLLKQFRFPTNESSWEPPMGGINGAEPAEAAARRELMEEVGLRAKDLVRIGEYRPVPGLTPEKVTVFVVRVVEEDLDASIASWSASEEIQEVSTVSLTDLVGMITDGRVTDGCSLTALLLLRLWLDQYASNS
jgi:8-oxo-dGTP pyrophosphatase MutT (NUDIX family)